MRRPWTDEQVKTLFRRDRIASGVNPDGVDDPDLLDWTVATLAVEAEKAAKRAAS